MLKAFLSSTCCRDRSGFLFSRGHVLAQHHGKPDAALNSVELDLVKAVVFFAEDRDGKAELALRGGNNPAPQTGQTRASPMKVLEPRERQCHRN